MARMIQHKQEAYWFYRFVSIGYDRFINPFFWNERMREEALQLAQLDDANLMTLDAGAGTGFTTSGIVGKIVPKNVTMLDQSPHQLAKARQKALLEDCQKIEGDVEDLPFATDTFDRYISAGSIEYWPEPQRAICEAYRVLKPGGIALIIGPLQRKNPLARWLSDTWMLFPPEEDYLAWYEAAGFVNLQKIYIEPDWYDKGSGNEYAIAVAGIKPIAGHSAFKLPPKRENLQASLNLSGVLVFAYRFLIGSLAGALFVPIALYRSVQKKLKRQTIH